jgi:hypothetical protein
MTVVRAIERRDLIERPYDEQLPVGHEMDWLATGIGRDRRRFWQYFGGHEPGSSLNEIFEKRESMDELAGIDTRGAWKWHILTGPNARALWSPGAQDANHTLNASQMLVKLRKRLGILSKWTGPASQAAVALASSIDEVMNALFPSEDTTTFVWSLSVRFGDEDQWIRLVVEKPSTGKPWISNAAEIEATLSLWLYHARGSETQADRTMGAIDSIGQFDPEDWLRSGDLALQRQNLQFLGPDTASLRRDLKWWIPGARSSTLLRIDPVQSRGPLISTNTDILLIDHTKVTGFSKVAQSHDAAVIEGSRSEYTSQALPLDEIEGVNGGSSGSALAIMSDSNTMEISYAQHLFSAFMWAVSQKVTTIEGRTTAQQTDMFNNPTAWKSLQLENTVLSRVARAVQKSGLGSLEDVYLCIIPPLSLSNKLPVAAAVDSVLQTIKDREANSSLEELSAIHLELLRFGTRFGANENGMLCPFGIKAVAVVTGTIVKYSLHTAF